MDSIDEQYQTVLALLADLLPEKPYHNLCANVCAKQGTVDCPHADRLPEAGHCDSFEIDEQLYREYVGKTRVPLDMPARLDALRHHQY